MDPDAMTQPNPRRGGVAGVALMVCAAAALAGLGFDFAQASSAPFWLGARAGGAALIGAAAAVFCLLAGIIGGVLIGRGDSDADA